MTEHTRRVLIPPTETAALYEVSLAMQQAGINARVSLVSSPDGMRLNYTVIARDADSLAKAIAALQQRGWIVKD